MHIVAAKQVSKYFLKEGNGDEAGWAAEPDPQGSSVQFCSNLTSEAVEPLRRLQRNGRIKLTY